MTNELNKTDLAVDCFLVALKTEGFVKKSPFWYLDTEETILVLKADIWRFEGRAKDLYIRFGIWIKILADEVYLKEFEGYNIIIDPLFPKRYCCHIRFSLGLSEKDGDAANGIFYFRKRSSPNEVDKYILNKDGMPVLRQLSTIKGIVQSFNDGVFEYAGIDQSAKELIESARQNIAKDL
jgi:hypothetical protein